MKGNRIITIGRQIGSGGSEIGMEVAKRLGIQCYDRQLIEMACNYGELDQDILAEAEEKRPNPFLYSVPRQMQNDKTGRGIAINDMVFNLQSEVIRQLAEKESCVIIGRCADYVLRDTHSERNTCHSWCWRPHRRACPPHSALRLPG